MYLDTSADTWKHAHTLTNKITIYTHLRYFQYKILNRILTTNIYLTIICLNDSELCDICGEEVETIHHLMVSCTHVKLLWEHIFDWF
jgi:hypothetical protein